jgi:hypothetical protein
MIGGTIVVILLVLVFIFTFVIPIARSKGAEGFAINMSNYTSERIKMKNAGSQLYNQLGSSLDPTLPNFGVNGVTFDPNLTDEQYAQKFNAATQEKNKAITIALQTPDELPTNLSPTNMAVTSQDVTPQLPPSNDLYITALRCQASITKRSDCYKLDDPKNALCGICIKGGTKFDGSSPNTFIGGLLSMLQGRTDAEDVAGGETPVYQPTLGKCPPGMFYVDSSSCKKAVNRLDCAEIGETGGFQGGKTIEGRTLADVSCAQAPIAGANTYVYQPTDEKTAAYPVILRVISPFGTGITKIVVTHQRSGKTYTADNSGNPGQEFALTLPSVMEADYVNVLVVQEMPNRTKGQPEVFQVQEQVANGQMNKYDIDSAKALCSRIGANLATTAQLRDALNNGIQSSECGIVSDQTTSMYAAQTGSSVFRYLPIGGAPGLGGCQNSGSASASAAWCYGSKPAATVTNPTIPSPVKTSVLNWFNSFGPPQGPSVYSKYSEPGASDPPGNSERAVIIQWEMKDSKDRTVPFLQTVSKINGNLASPPPPTPSPLRLRGPFTGSSVISGPVWNSNMSMIKNQFWFWSNSPNSPTVTFVAQVPGYLENPYYTDDLETAPMGPLITKQSTSALLKTSPCMVDGQNPGSYSAACLLELFQGVGGVPGTGALSTKNGGITQLNGYGDLNAISTYLNGLYKSATVGKDVNGNVLSYDLTTRMKAMNGAAQLLFGFDIVNPCEQIVDNPDGSVGVVAAPMINVTPQCLQYLWLNTGSDSNRKGSAGAGRIYDGTYTNIADRFSGLMNTESTPARREQYPFQACQRSGTMAPVKNGKPDISVVNKLMGMPNLQAIQNYFDEIFKTANNYGGKFGNVTADQSAAQAVAIQQCYGINQAKNAAKGYGCDAVTDGLALWFDGADPLGNGTTPAPGTRITTLIDKSGKRNNATAQRGGGSFVAGGGIGLGGGYYTLNAPYSQTNTLFLVATGLNNNTIGGGAYYYNFDRTNFGSIIINSDYGWASPLSLFDNLNGITGQFIKGNTLTRPFLASVLQIPGKGVFGNFNGNRVISKSPYTAGSASAITVLGAALPSGDSTLQGGQVIYEFILYNRALSSTEIQTIEKQLACKWKLPSCTQ